MSGFRITILVESDCPIWDPTSSQIYTTQVCSSCHATGVCWCWIWPRGLLCFSEDQRLNLRSEQLMTHVLSVWKQRGSLVDCLSTSQHLSMKSRWFWLIGSNFHQTFFIHSIWHFDYPWPHKELCDNDEITQTHTHMCQLIGQGSIRRLRVDCIVLFGDSISQTHAPHRLQAPYIA